jgi:hypothetical protein
MKEINGDEQLGMMKKMKEDFISEKKILLERVRKDKEDVCSEMEKNQKEIEKSRNLQTHQLLLLQE